MLKTWLAGLGIGLVGVGWWAGSHHSTAAGNSTPGSVVSDVNRPGADNDRLDGDGTTIAALRAQLRQRDRLVGAMALASARARQTSSDETKSETRTVQTIRKLDQRLSEGAPSQPGGRDLRASMEGALRGLPNTVKAGTHCSAELCRVTVEGAEDQLDGDSGQLLERLPKEFAGTMVLSDGAGRRLVYAAVRSELLVTSDRSADQ